MEAVVAVVSKRDWNLKFREAGDVIVDSTLCTPVVGSPREGLWLFILTRSSYRVPERPVTVAQAEMRVSSSLSERSQLSEYAHFEIAIRRPHRNCLS